MFNSDTLELQEEFIVLYLNRSNKTLGWFKLSQGGIAVTIVDIKLVLATGLKCGASSLIVAHNHPSGNTEFSENDKKIGLKLYKACKVVDLTLLDSLVITTDSYNSMADDGLLFD